MHYQPTQSAKGLGRHVVRSDGFGTCCEEAQFRFTSALGGCTRRNHRLPLGIGPQQAAGFFSFWDMSNRPGLGLSAEDVTNNVRIRLAEVVRGSEARLLHESRQTQT